MGFYEFFKELQKVVTVLSQPQVFKQFQEFSFLDYTEARLVFHTVLPFFHVKPHKHPVISFSLHLIQSGDAAGEPQSSMRIM